MRAGARWKALVALGLCLALGVGCSSGESEKTSSTPRIKSTAKALEPGVLTLAQVRAALGAPEYRRTSSKGVNLYDNPDPRGPCGAKVTQPSFRHGAVASFRNRTSAVITMVIEPGVSAATQALDDLAADAKPGCPPFESTTNFGETQRVIPMMVPLPPLADGAIASGGIVTIGDNPRTVLAGIAVRDGGRVVFTQLISGSDVPESSVVALARESAKALERLDRNSA
jgi:hypothetical protein